MSEAPLLTVESIMSAQVHTVTPDFSLGKLREVFERVHYHHLLVHENDILVGVVSDRDVAKYLSPFMDTDSERSSDRQQLKLSVADIMANELITVDRDASLDFASILLLENNISCLPVVNEHGKIDGILSWKDILKYHVYGSETEDS